ncbi:MAG: hypothetical protein COT00_01560 [Candidatus Omnitrophica bacterium CG07_land_8_20_14_0_80_50_8]|nr:MAG: hypothetical protein AUJ71_00605 [Candidatus Omnitrophica bacterium CG1_02_49_16]PIU40465.1 MAG: hypothetical protein COT00_01560 [Candidatus Omnitrophica bacterium CG07_land_8_20_14_0_80_50_8]
MLLRDEALGSAALLAALKKQAPANTHNKNLTPNTRIHDLWLIFIFRNHLFFAKPISSKTLGGFGLIGHLDRVVNTPMGPAFQFI